MAKAARLREIDRVKREKQQEKKERERLRAEIAKDKAERRARGGKLAGKLGVEGYNATIDTNDARRDQGVPAEPPAAPARVDVAQLAKGKVVAEGAPKAPELPPPQAVDKAIASLQRYKTAGDGATALKTLGAYVRNALAKGDQDPKFRTIKLDNAAFKKRVSGLVGGVALLKAVGFVKDEGEGVLQLSLEARDANKALLEETVGKLEKGYNDYLAGKCG
mmetsp:Transcript_19858/g.59112  ORF Transcript_19858/g.59112 Transcript_19858/m.59112 type:complete len:220 (+) Transcript_19858:759-1418(+)